MIRILAGMAFGVLFISPAISIPLERVNFDPLNQIFKDVAVAIIKMGLETVSGAL